MSYLKKICLLKEYKAGLSTTGKKLSGMIKCEDFVSGTKLELSVLDLAPPQNDNYLLFIGNSNKNVVYTINSGFAYFNCSKEVLDISLPFGAIIILEKTQEVVMFGKTLDYPLELKDFLKIYKEKSLTLYLEEERIEKEIDNAYEYSDDVVATENYYENDDVDLKNLTLKDGYEELKNESVDNADFLKKEEQEKEDNAIKNEQSTCPIQEELTSKDCPDLLEFSTTLQDSSLECFSINEDVENLLNSYPRFAELENAIYKSRWVIISLEGCEYYFGRATLQDEGYLCYAVKGEIGACPKELENLATFIPSPYSKNAGYYVMFQKEN